MGKRMTREQCEARALALEEAAEHLSLAWTDDASEYEQGKIVADQLLAQAEAWRAKAEDRSHD